MSGDERRSAEVDAYVAKLAPPIREIVEALRRLVLQASPRVREEVKWRIPTYSQNGLVCFIMPTKAYVSLGFYRGIELTDPGGLLKGEGKKIRAVKIQQPNDIQTELFTQLVQEAVRLNG